MPHPVARTHGPQHTAFADTNTFALNEAAAAITAIADAACAAPGHPSHSRI